MHRALAVAAVVAGLATATACGVDVAGGGDGAAGGMAALLGRVPATAGTADFVVLNLHERAREAAGLAVPGRADADAVDDYRMALTFDPSNGLVLHPARVTGVQHRSLAEWRAELGFDLLDVDADALAGTPPDHVEVVLGSIDPGDVEDAAAAEPVWSDLLDVGEHDGTTVLSWGEQGGIDVERRTAARPVGESVRLAVEDGAVAWARTDAVVEATVEAWHGDAGSLADVEELADLADVLDAEGCHAAFLSTAEDQFGVAVLPQPPPGDMPLVPRWEAAATGATVAGGSPALVVALRYGSAADAGTAAGVLEQVVAEGSSVVGGQRWSDLLAGTDVRAEGDVVVGMFPTDQARLWFDVPSTKDTLILWR